MKFSSALKLDDYTRNSRLPLLSDIIVSLIRLDYVGVKDCFFLQKGGSFL